MRHFLSSISLRYKILLGNLVLLVLLLFPSLFVYMDAVNKAMASNTTYMQQLNDQASLNVNLMFSALDRINFIHYSDGEMRRILNTDADEVAPVEQFENDTYLRNAMIHAFRNDNFIVRGGIINRYGDAYCSVISDTEAYGEYVTNLIQDIDWQDDPYEVYFTGVHEEVIQQSPRQVITMVQRLYYFGTYIGTICVDVNYERITSQFDAIFSGDSISSLCVLGEDGSLLYSSSNNGLSEEITKQDQAILDAWEEIFPDLKNGKVSPVNFGGKDYLVAAVRNGKTGWLLIQYASMDALNELIFRGVQNMVLVFAAVLVLAVLFSVFMSKQIIKPLKKMIADIRLTGKGHLSLLQIPSHIHHTEVGALMQYYNTMIQRINHGIDQTLLYELDHKRMELKMLQYQINPHFMYNTLNTISAIAEIENIPQIMEITDNLSQLLRYNVKEQNVVSVEDEIRFARNYLQIQDIRFPGRFLMDIQISPEAECCFMLKFLLQPVVENCFSHGLFDKRTDAQVKITGWRDGPDLYLTIYDNGVGMEPQECEEWNRRLQADEPEQDVDSIGMVNVNSRIRSFYGAPYGVTVESELGEFTKITLHLKALERREDLLGKAVFQEKLDIS